jgi:four helix bundle protein
MKELDELDVYNLAEKLSDNIWFDFDNWTKKTQNTIGYQIIRAADSIAANIAEGYGRYSPAERVQFYRYARGSFEETKTWLRKLIRRKIIVNEVENYRRLVDELGPKLNGFIKSTQKLTNND